MTTIISWNVNGLQGILKKDASGMKNKKVQINNPIKNIIEYESPDILCLQEIRCSEKFVHNSHFADYKYQYVNYAKNRKGYSGTLIASKIRAISAHYDFELLGGELDNNLTTEGRIITLEFEKYYLVNVYTPNSGVRGFQRLEWRVKVWEPTFRKYIKELMKSKEVVIVGDLNVIPTEKDIWNDKISGKITGGTVGERKAFEKLINLGLTDCFRAKYPNKKRYSWVYGAVSTGAKSKRGFRMDFTLVSSGIENYSKVRILSYVGSDHLAVRVHIV